MPRSATTRPAPAAPRSTGHRAGLDPDAVVARALAIVEEHGADALTMRRLAADLGVTTTTIYWHVGGRDDLVLAVIRSVAAELGTRPIRGRTPRARVMAVAELVWESAFEHRHVTALAHQVGATSLLEMELQVAMARELEAAGLRGAQVRDALRSILMCVAGFLVVALRRDADVPAELRSPALWSDVHADLHPDTIAALREPADVHALFRDALGALVAHHVPATVPHQERP